MKQEVEIIICGDLCPTKDTEIYFEQADVKSIFSNCLPIFKKADFLFGNLEFVLTDAPKPIMKSGPILHGPTSFIQVLKQAGFDLLSLANNHIKDCGEDGVQSTIATCAQAGIATLGAARNLNEAKKPYIKEINGLKIAFLSFAEQEFNCATTTEYGANYLDPFEDLDLIAEVKKQVDYLIVIYHGGIEYYEYPSPLLQKKCRKFIDKGADFVTCQHSHCIGTIEEYKDKNIMYGQGNTLFGYRDGNNSWNQGLILKLTIVKEEPIKMNIFGVAAVEEGGIQLLTEEQNKKVISALNKRSEFVYDPKFIEDSWNSFCMKKRNLYLPQFLSLNRYLIHLNRISKNFFISLFYKKKSLRASHNIIRCEAHNEVIQTILKKQTE